MASLDSGGCTKRVGFPPLRASEKRSHSSLGLSQVNLGSRGSYKHGGRGPQSTDLVVTPSFKALTGEAPGLSLPPNSGIEINPTFSPLISIDQD
jgi:hypothetical protein